MILDRAPGMLPGAAATWERGFEIHGTGVSVGDRGPSVGSDHHGGR